MKKSLYKKFYVTFLTVMLAGFFLLGSIVLAFSGNYFMGQNKGRLISQSQTAAQQLSYATVQLDLPRLSQYVNQLSAMFAQATNTELLVVSSNGTVMANTGLVLETSQIPEEQLTRYRSQTAAFTGNLGGALKGNCAIAASPITANGQWVGVVYSVLPLKTIGDFLRDLLQLLLIAALLTAVLVGFGAYAMASAMVRPLAQMSKAAKCLAQGDFSQRIQGNRQDEIGQLADAFNQMTLSLEAGEKMRHGFVANVSHELKTPMTTISGFVDGMIDGTIPSEQHPQYLAIVSAEVKRLSRLVNTMLGLSKLESGETPLHPAHFDLKESVLQAVFMFEQQIEQKNITLKGLEEFPSLPLFADGDLTHQAIYNLIDNSVKYTPKDGTVTITGREEDRKVYFTVRNTGEGIHPDHLPFVFDRFYKVDQSRGADKNSLGLGLYLVKTIMSLHNGQITVRSVEGSFCEFELVFPSDFTKTK